MTGRLHLLHEEMAAAGESFDLEARYQRESHRYTDMGKALLHAGEAYAKAAKHDVAGDRFYRAAVCLVAQEKPARALQALAAAAAEASQSGDTSLQRRIDVLRSEIKPAPPAASSADQ